MGIESESRNMDYWVDSKSNLFYLCLSSLKPIYFGNGIKKHHLKVIDTEKEWQFMK